MRSRIIMSMLTGVALLVSTLLGAVPAQSADLPAEFGTDWRDPITAAPPVTRPAHARSCEVTVAEAQFKDFTPYRGAYTPPRGCGKRWSKVVLRLDGKVKGRQFDRLGHLYIGGVEVFRTSTPQPSPDGIEWSVEKDVTRYADTLRTAQPVEMLIGNVVDDTYTGIIDVKVTLTFYAGRSDAKTAAAVPDRVLTLQDNSTLTTPRNSERVVAEVYATGSGGGCEEYWYLTVPDEAPYSCKADEGPYREVQIEVDGRLAGIAAPFPQVWTGGWSNPFLWQGLGKNVPRSKACSTRSRAPVGHMGAPGARRSDTCRAEADQLNGASAACWCWHRTDPLTSCSTSRSTVPRPGTFPFSPSRGAVCRSTRACRGGWTTASRRS